MDDVSFSTRPMSVNELATFWMVGKQEVSNSQEKWIISVFKKPLGSVP
jgi:hypothetical protein